MSIESKVMEMYSQIPYPEYGNQALTKEYVANKMFIDHILDFDGKHANPYKNKLVLEAGCGTGRESMYLASRGARLTAIDINDTSLQAAIEQSKKHQFDHDIQFMKASVLELPFPDNSFDVVLSSGVIHHTDNPTLAFTELDRVLKPGGILILYVYNYYAHIISNLRRSLVFIFSGKNIHKRAAIAKKLFPVYLRNKPLASVYDEFAHPHKSEHTISEILEWFENHEIEYQSVYPKFGFKGAKATRNSRRLFMKEGRFTPIGQKYNRVSGSNIFFSNLFQFFFGFIKYSGGYRFLGIKKIQGE